MRGIPHQAAEKAEVTQEDLRLLLTTGEKENSGAQIHLGEDRKAAYQQNPLVSLSQVNSSQLRVPKSKPQPELLEKMLRAN